MDFGGLAVGVSCGDALAKGIQAAHPRLDPASGVVSRPTFPERPAVVAGGAQCLVSGVCSRAVFFPKTSSPVDRDDRGALPVDDGGVAAARVIGAVGGHGADLLVPRDLAQQIGEHGAVGRAAGVGTPFTKKPRHCAAAARCLGARSTISPDP